MSIPQGPSISKTRAARFRVLQIGWMLPFLLLGVFAWRMPIGESAPAVTQAVASQSSAGRDAPAAKQEALLGAERKVELPEDESSFASIDKAGVRIHGAAQDGIGVVVRSAGGEPEGGALVRVQWGRSVDSWWLSGHDRGAADTAGVFRTSIQVLDEVAKIEVRTRDLGWLECRPGDDGWQWAESPERSLCVVLPDLCDLTVAIADEQGVPVAGVGVTVETKPRLLGPGEHAALLPEGSEEYSGVDGRAHFLVPSGPAKIFAGSDSHFCDHILHCELPKGACELRDVVAKSPHVQPVSLVVQLPPGLNTRVRVNAETSHMTKSPAQLLVSHVESIRRWFSVDPTNDNEFTINANAVPWYLRVDAEGCEPFGSWVDPNRRELRIQLARRSLAERCRIHGRVLDAAGVPVADAVVKWSFANRANWNKPDTAADGSYELVLDASKTIVLWARGADSWRGSLFRGPIETKAGSDIEIDFKLGAAGAIRGTLLGDSGTPAEGMVSLQLVGVGSDGFAIAGTAATNGEFVMDGLGAGDYLLRAERDGWPWPAWKRVRVGDVVVLRSGDGLEGMALVEGVVVDAESRAPLRGISVEGTGETDEQGRFRLVMKPGAADIAAYGPGRAHAVARLPALVAGHYAITIPMQVSVPRFVRLVDALGRSVPYAEIRVIDESVTSSSSSSFRPLLDADGEHAWSSVDTDDAGRADIRGLPAGRLRLSILGNSWENGYRYQDSAAREFVLEPAEGVRSVAVLRW